LPDMEREVSFADPAGPEAREQSIGEMQGGGRGGHGRGLFREDALVALPPFPLGKRRVPEVRGKGSRARDLEQLPKPSNWEIGAQIKDAPLVSDYSEPPTLTGPQKGAFWHVPVQERFEGSTSWLEFV